jgi:O-antigen/teichoic acid export membrane protein
MHYSLTRATMWNLVGYLYLLVAALIATPILVHSLGLTQFAEYSVVVGTLALVSSFDLGLPQAVVRQLAKNTLTFKSRQTIWATSSLLFILTGIVAGLASVIPAYLLHLPAGVLVVVFALGLINNLVAHYQTLPQAEGHFGYFNSKTFIVGTGNTLFAAYLSWIGQSLTVILSAQLGCYFLTLLVLAYFSLKYFPHPRAGRPTLQAAKPLVAFGLKNQVGKIVGQVQAQYAKYLLATLSPLTLSAYVIAQGLVMAAAGGISQLSTALYPAAARGGRSLRTLYHSLQIGLVILGLLGIGIYKLFGYSFLIWWLKTPELVTLVNSALNIFVWYLFILILTPLPSAMLDGHGRPEVTSLFAFATTGIEIVLALVLFPHFGFFAPIYAAIITAILTTPILLFVTERVLASK